MPTIKDVARYANVSIATVSNVLNNKSGMVSEEVRQLVLDAIEKVGYTPNATARNLRASQTRLLGYAWYDATSNQANLLLDRFTYFLAQSAELAGYHLLTFAPSVKQPLSSYQELMRTQRVDGFVLTGTMADDDRIKFLLEENFPFVSFGRSNIPQDFPWVDTDGIAGMRKAIQYLTSLGHRQIAMAAWPEGSLSGDFRVQGYLQGLQLAGIPLNPKLLIRGVNTHHFGRQAWVQWATLPSHERPTAVVAVSDLIAIGVMMEAEQHGLAIGRDLSIIGFDDSPIAPYVHPPLTTVQQDLPATASMLISLLQCVLQKEPFTLEYNVLVEPHLVLRASCGRAPIDHITTFNFDDRLGD